MSWCGSYRASPHALAPAESASLERVLSSAPALLIGTFCGLEQNNLTMAACIIRPLKSARISQYFDNYFRTGSNLITNLKHSASLDLAHLGRRYIFFSSSKINRKAKSKQEDRVLRIITSSYLRITVSLGLPASH